MPLTYPFKSPPPAGQFTEVAPGILWARMPLPLALDHVNVYLVEDDGGWTVVDAGMDTGQTRASWAALLGRLDADSRVGRAIITHFHPDHVGAAGWLSARVGARLLMTPTEHRASKTMREMAESDIRGYRSLFAAHGLEHAQIDRILSRGWDYRFGVGALPGACDHIDEGDVLEIGGRSLRVIVGSGHSPALAMLHDEPNHVLICADQVLGRISPNVSVLADEPFADPLGDYLSSILRLRRLVPDDVLVLPGHDLPFHGLHERIDSLVRHHEERCRMIEHACHERPMSAGELVPHVFRRNIEDGQLGHALTETLAHVNLMLRQERLAVEDATGRPLYRTA